jgi:hypothetical protein
VVLLGTFSGPMKDIKASEIPDAPRRTERAIAQPRFSQLLTLLLHVPCQKQPNTALQGKDADWRGRAASRTCADWYEEIGVVSLKSHSFSGGRQRPVLTEKTSPWSQSESESRPESWSQPES